MDRARLDEIVATVNRVLLPVGYVCIEAEWSAHDRVLRLYVDFTDQGRGTVNLDACVEASQLLMEYQELDELVPGRYTLEVSSPGVDRPLRRLEDFTGVIGQTVEVRLSEKVMNRKNGKGRLTSVVPGPSDGGGSLEGARITLDTAEGIWTFPLASLLRAHLIYDWGDA